MAESMKQSTRPDGISVIAIYYFIIALLNLIGACAIVVFPIAAVISNTSDEGLYFALAGLGLGLCAVLVLSIMALAAGIGLFRMATWGRWLGLAMAVFTLVLFPIGTIIGVFIIWYLLKAETREAFEASPY
jgi:hypothetical protein